MPSLNLRLGSRRVSDLPRRGSFCQGSPPQPPRRTLVIVNASAPGPGPGYLAVCPDQRRVPPLGYTPDVAPAVDAFHLPTHAEVRVVPLRRLTPTAARVPIRSRAFRAVAATVAGLPMLALPGPVFAAPTHPVAVPPASEPTTPQRPDDRPDDPTQEAAGAEPTGPTDPAERPPAPEASVPPPVPALSAASTIDAAWEGVVGYDVVMELTDGTTAEGRISAVQRDTFTLIDFAAGGKVWVLQKSRVTSLRVQTPKPLPQNTGTGMIAGGAILATLGGPVLLTGVVFLGLFPSGFAYMSLPMLLTGGPAVGAGIALVVAGSKRRRAYNTALHERGLSLTPSGGRTRLGTWTGGLTLRF